MKARLLILLAAVLWSTAGVAIKYSGLSGWQLAGGRSLVAALFLFTVFRQARQRPQRRTWPVAVAYAGTVVIFVLANKLTTAANAIFLQDTAPLWVMLLGPWLLQERPTRSEWLAVPAFGLGLVLFFVDRLGPGQLAGNLLALVSGVCFALLMLGMRALRSSNEAAVAWGNLFAFAVALPFMFSGPAPTGSDGAVVLFLGVCQLGLAYTLFARGVRDVPAAEASLLVLIEPVLNPLWTFLLLGERPGPWALVGGGISPDKVPRRSPRA